MNKQIEEIIKNWCNEVDKETLFPVCMIVADNAGNAYVLGTNLMSKEELQNILRVVTHGFAGGKPFSNIKTIN